MKTMIRNVSDATIQIPASFLEQHQSQSAAKFVAIRPYNDPLAKSVDWPDRVVVASCLSIFAVYTVIILFESLILPEKHWCLDPVESALNAQKEYPNSDTASNTYPCYYVRSPLLLGMNAFECDFARRCLAAVLLGSVIGYERKVADRPAGIRTMSLVCLGACIFTMSSQFAFKSSPQAWDAARVSAAIPSGVGFLGSALIWKESTKDDETESEQHQIHGITTAASVWISASVGIGAGGAMYLYSIWAVILVIFVLRLLPRLALYILSSTEEEAQEDDESYGDEGEAETNDGEHFNIRAEPIGDAKSIHDASADHMKFSGPARDSSSNLWHQKETEGLRRRRKSSGALVSFRS